MSLTPETAALVRISWSDIVLSDQWQGEDQPVQPVESMTVGYLLEETPQMIVLGSSYDYRAATWGTVHAFPKTAPEITVIKKGSNHET